MTTSAIAIPLHDAKLEGNLELPDDLTGLVLFAHGSGSGRHSPRNQSVARALRRVGVGTLLFDLLTAEEEQEDAVTRRLRFDIQLLARRLAGATRWALAQPAVCGVGVGYFGASTGAAAALVAAAELGPAIGAVVSRGGRPDLADQALPRVTAPTLLIVGGDDTAVIPLNEAACARLRREKCLRIVAGASHLFEEPGALDAVAAMAAEWFVVHLRPLSTARAPDAKRPGAPPA